MLFKAMVMSYVLSTLSVNAADVEKWIETFDRDQERARVIALMTNYPVPEVQITDLDSASAQQQQFIDHFQKYIWLELRELPELTRIRWDPPGGRIEIVNNAINRALFNSDVEEKQWEKWQQEISDRYERVLSSPEWQGNVKKWADLSEGLTGELPDLARRMHYDLQVNEFTPAELPLMEKLTEIDLKLSELSRKSKYLPTLAANEKMATDIVENFHKGTFTFEAAWRALEALRVQGRIAFGQDVATKGAGLLQQAAEVRTELARRKGYKTWAQYVLSTYARHHAEGMKTVSEWSQFLQSTLDQTKEPTRRFLAKRMGEFGVNFETARPSQLALLSLPAEILVREFFPTENIEKIWRQSMLDSGFSQASINSIHLDMFPRAHKHNHAYLSYNVPARPKLMKISASRLQVDAPNPEDKSLWIPAALDIIQNMRDDGVDSISTMLHEGGHGLHHSAESPNDIWGNGASNAFSETHSMTMELYLEDVGYLLKVGQSRDGKKLDRETAERFVLESRIEKLLSLRRTAAMSLVDLQIWDYEYSPTSEKFVDRAMEVYGKYSDEASQVPRLLHDGVDSRFSLFSTAHFYSGDCRYWGYAGAQIAAEMTFASLLDHLEKTTGRRSVVDQPGIAPFLTEGIYKDGGKIPFPASVERLTGIKYSPATVVKKAIEAADGYQPCAENLRRMIF